MRGRFSLSDVPMSNPESTADPAEPLCTWEVPGVVPGSSTTIIARPGETTTLVGANGTGKSALGHWLQNNASDAPVVRLIAHRRLWFEHAGPNITAADRIQMLQNFTSWNRDPQSRWLDHGNTQRAGIVLYDLLARENERNARVAGLHDAGASHEEIAGKVEASPLARLNGVLRSANLDVEMVLTDQGTLDAVNAARAATYPISQMSDGEKSALLLAAEVLAGPSGAVQIIDEPERHLHRSISAGLIEAVIAERPDCHFAVLTHDLELAALLPRAPEGLYVLMGCSWSRGAVTGWDIHPVDEHSEVSESVRRAILGGRQKILFIEGEAHSLDPRLYSLLFPGWTVQPSGGCEEVIRAVVGVAASGSHHWVEARGIVDGDGRTDVEREALAKKGIRVLPVGEIESIYYSSVVMQAVADGHGKALGKPAADLMSSAVDGALSAIGDTDTPERLAAAAAEASMRRAVFGELPGRKDLQKGADPILVSVASPYPKLLADLKQLLAAKDLDGILRGYPIRDTALRGKVATALGFQNSGDYEAAARVVIGTQDLVIAGVRALVGDLPTPSK